MSPFPRPDVLLKSFGKAAPLLFVVGMRSTSAEEEKRRGKPRTVADAAGRESMAASAQRQTGRSAPVILPKSAILRNQSKPSSERECSAVPSGKPSSREVANISNGKF